MVLRGSFVLVDQAFEHLPCPLNAPVAAGWIHGPTSGTPKVRFSVANRAISTMISSLIGGGHGGFGWRHILATLLWCRHSNVGGDDAADKQGFRQGSAMTARSAR
ncbi:hypothetical protein ACFFS4_35615 [Kutzneria kofuensis]|uniref:Uncharacterized protein n=1 Tax=Kutzneria kofuensis TaxID=103725 RepID=A0A7W9KC36_9PSEU|nr:hypothetical protein [Kutzneria kofuensis]MBB5889889.1 hypothetical protein [Kutzneria kofuensis]